MPTSSPEALQAPWERKAAARRAALYEQIPKEWLINISPPNELPCVIGHTVLLDILSPVELDITSTPTAELLEALRDGKFTAEAVVTAFCKRSAIAQQALGCAAEFLFDEALETARKHDELLRTTGRTAGPLHGLPISIKDAFDIAGHATTCGLISRLDQIPNKDTPFIAILREAGAIPFVKTCTSQACLLVESTSNLFGTVLNPWNRALSAGGSSGGEGALVAFRGSPLGIGTDGGGSLRIPAAWNGIYTLKPTAARMPGFASGTGYSTSNSANQGPLTNDLASIHIFFQAVLDAKPWLRDPAVVPLPWRPEAARPPTRPLKIGLLLDDGIIHNSPPVTRALQEAAHALRAAGHEVVELTSPEWPSMHRRAAQVAFTMYTEEGGIGLREALDASGEPPVPRVCTGWTETPLTPMQIWANHRDRSALRMEYVAAYQALELDAIMVAPMPHPAPPHGQYITSAICAVYNALDFPSCVIPFGRVDLAKDIAEPSWYAEETYPDMPNFPYDRYDRDMRKLYTGPHVFENAPLAMQIVSLPFQEEHCLAVAEVIEGVLLETA